MKAIAVSPKLAVMAFAVICQTAVPAAGTSGFALKKMNGLLRGSLIWQGWAGTFVASRSFWKESRFMVSPTLAVLAFFHPPVPNVFNQFLDFVVGLLHFHKWHKHAAHLGAVNDGGLGADELSRRARRQCAGAFGMVLMQCMQRTHSLVLMLSFLETGSLLHAAGGTAFDDFLFDVERAPVAAGMGAGIGFQLSGHIPARFRYQS